MTLPAQSMCAVDLRYLACSTGHPLFYDVPWGDPRVELTLVAAVGELPAGWGLTSRGPWTIVASPNPLPSAGWKVHVACRPEHAEQVLRRVAETCFASGTAFKFLSSTRLVQDTQAKYAEATAAGKVVVAYPPDPEACERLVDFLRPALAEFPGARIPGDVAVMGTAMGVRYGAYFQEWTRDERGALVPAIRTAGGSVHDDRRRFAPTPDEPAFVRRLREEAALHDAQLVLPISDVSLLHRSNAGGVYRARWQDGATVVIKEARHHTGFDASGSDAVTRLAHEYAVLARLADSGHAPRPRELLTVGASDFLVMEHLDGPTCQQVAARNHPLSISGATAREVDDYLTWCEQVARAGRVALKALHSQGVTHGDVMPANAVWQDDRIVLIDLESASLDGRRAAGEMGTPGFQLVPPGSPEADLVSWRVVEEFLLRPETSLAPTDEGVREAILADTATVNASSVAPAQVVGPRQQAAIAAHAEELWRGIEWSMEMLDDSGPRLFPGDIAGILHPGAGVGLLHGAAGVVLAAQAAGREVPPSWLDWIEDHLPTIPGPSDGLADGSAGVSMVLGLTGRLDAARRAWPKERPAVVPWWSNGAAGHLVAAAELWLITGDAHWRRRLVEAWRQLDAFVGEPGQAPGWSAGLVDGWGGVSLALLRAAEVLEAAPVGGASVDGVLSTARKAWCRDEAALVPRGAGLVLRSGPVLMPYLGGGTAAMAWAAHELSRHGVLDRPGLLEACTATLGGPMTMGVSLLRGRAGMVAALDLLRPGDPAMVRQQERMAWHTVPAAHVQDPGRPGPTRSLGQHLAPDLAPPHGIRLCPGEMGLRYSSDVATGAAGVVAALMPDPARAVAHLLRLPIGDEYSA